MKERGSCGVDDRANSFGCIVGGWGDGNSEVEKCPVRTFQPIVRGKVVQKMHIFVSRCLFTLVMSLAGSFRVLCISLCRKTHLYSSVDRPFSGIFVHFFYTHSST